MISINDFDCKLYGNSIPSRFANSQNGNQPVPFEEFYSRYIFADYLHENGDVFIDHYIWITKDKITDSDVKSAMEYDSRSEGKTRITNISIPQITGGQFESIICFEDYNKTCELALGFNRILTKYRVSVYDDTSLEVFQEIVNIIAVKTGERILIIDQNLP